jgi:hypothetical protein
MSIKISTCSGIFAWKPAAWLRVSGADAQIFLQGQFTNDLRALERQAEVYGLWLSVKGKVLADSFVLRGARPEEFWVGSYFSRAEVIRERLEGYIIADDVVIEDVTADWAAVSAVGGELGADLAAVAPEGVVFRGRRVAGGNVEWAFPRAREAAVSAALSGKAVLSAEDIARARIAAGIPAVPGDIGPADLPNEGGLESEAISYTKGCYLGQEVMARLKSMGQIRRRLLRVQGAGAPGPASPAPVFVGARQVGELRSAVSDGEGGWMGLALVSLLQVSAGVELALAPEAPAVMRLIDSP